MQNHKITMLGLSQSGKSCFLYAMYDFMQQVRNGFTFIAKDPDDDLELADGWESISVDKKWPDGNVTTKQYDFIVQFKSNSVMEFSWYDYRGGALKEKSDQSPEAKDLIDRIIESDCLVICIGADIIKAIWNGDKSKNSEVRRLNALINTYASRNERRIPVIFAITKADMFDKAEQPNLLQWLTDNFSSLYVEGSGWMHAVVPVRLGENLQTGSAQEVIGNISPKNIHIPVMFFLHSILRERIKTIKNKLAGIQTKRSNYRTEINRNQGRTWWDKLWNGDNTSILQNNIADLDTEENNIIKNIEPLEKAFENVEDMFESCRIFKEGQAVKY